MKKPYKSALAKPVPALGVAVGTKIPDSMDGIRYEVGRLIKFIQDSRKDPLVISTARKIAADSLGTARKLGWKVTPKNRQLIILKAIHHWCRENFEYVDDPVGVEVIQTPGRMLRDLEIPEQLATAMWIPIRNGMVPKKKAGKMTRPAPKMTGDSDEAVVIALSLAAAVGIAPLKMRFGGTGDCVHYVWGAARIGKRWWDFDFLDCRFGKHHLFAMYQDLEVEL